MNEYNWDYLPLATSAEEDQEKKWNKIGEEEEVVREAMNK